MSVILVGERESSKSVWAYPNSGGATPTWTADTGGHTNAVVTDDSGNVYVVGENSSSKNIWKYSATGSLTASYNVGAATTDLHDIKLLSDGTVVACGEPDGANYSLFTLDAALSSATQRGEATTDTTYRIAVDTSDNIYCLRISTNLRALTRKKYNSSFVEQFTGTIGVGSDLSVTALGLDCFNNGNSVLCFTYSAGVLYYVDIAGDLGGFKSSANNCHAVLIGSDDSVYLSSEGFIEKYTYSDGAFSNIWSAGDDGTFASNFAQNSNGTLYEFGYGFPE